MVNICVDLVHAFMNCKALLTIITVSAMEINIIIIIENANTRFSKTLMIAGVVIC